MFAWDFIVENDKITNNIFLMNKQSRFTGY